MSYSAATYWPVRHIERILDTRLLGICVVRALSGAPALRLLRPPFTFSGLFLVKLLQGLLKAITVPFGCARKVRRECDRSATGVDWSDGCRDRNAARAAVGGWFPTRTLSVCAAGAQVLHSSRFRKPPYDPGQSDFPSPVLTLAGPSAAFPKTRRLKCWLMYTPPEDGLHADLGAALRTTAIPDRCRGPVHARQVSRAPLPARGVTPDRVMSRITSGGVTLPSSLIRAHASDQIPRGSFAFGSSAKSGQVVASPCWKMALPDVISASPSPVAGTHIPAAVLVHVPVTSQDTSAIPTLAAGWLFLCRDNPHSDFRAERDFGTAVIPLCSGPWVCLPRWSLPPHESSSRAAVAFTSEHHLALLPPPESDMLVARTGQLTTRGLAPLRTRSLVGCIHKPSRLVKTPRGCARTAHAFTCTLPRDAANDRLSQ